MASKFLPADTPIDIEVFNKFSVASMGQVGNLNPFDDDKGIGYLNAFQEVTLPSPSFDVEPYSEGGWLGPKQVNSGYVEWSELTLSRGFATPMEENPIYNLYFNTRFGYKYRVNFLIRIYSLESIDPKSRIYNQVKRLMSAKRIVYAVIKGATLSDINLIDGLSGESSELNIAEMTFSITDMLLGVYDERKK